MSEKELFDQLFNIPSSPAPKEDPKDLLSSLLAAPLPKPPAQEKKRKQNNQDVHEYVRLAEKSNDKAKKSVQKWKQEQTLTPDEIRRKRQFEKVNAQFQKTKKEVSLVPAPSSSTSTPKKQFMPNIIDPFHKPEKNKPKLQTPTTHHNSKEHNPDKMRDEKTKEREKVDREERESREEKQRLAKVEAKLEKIKRKEMELAAERQQKEKLFQHQKAAAAVTAVKRQQRPLAKEQKSAKQTRKKESSSSSSESDSSSGSSSGSQSQEKYDWRKQLRSITKYNPNDQKFKKRDKCRIQQSGVDRIFGEDRHSYRQGKLQEQRDLQLQMQMKKRRMEKKNKHHKHHH